MSTTQSYETDENVLKFCFLSTDREGLLFIFFRVTSSEYNNYFFFFIFSDRRGHEFVQSGP